MTATVAETRASYGGARYRQQKAGEKSHPVWVYQSMQDAHVRPTHLAMHGRAFRADDPIWNTHYPPNAWNCRCRVRAMTEAQAARRGIQIHSSDGHLHQVEQKAAIDSRTGQPIMRPGTEYRWRDKDGREHTLLPDAGWGCIPGS